MNTTDEKIEQLTGYISLYQKSLTDLQANYNALLEKYDTVTVLAPQIYKNFFADETIYVHGTSSGYKLEIPDDIATKYDIYVNDININSVIGGIEFYIDKDSNKSLIVNNFDEFHSILYAKDHPLGYFGLKSISDICYIYREYNNLNNIPTQTNFKPGANYDTKLALPNNLNDYIASFNKKIKSLYFILQEKDSVLKQKITKTINIKFISKYNSEDVQIKNIKILWKVPNIKLSINHYNRDKNKISDGMFNGFIFNKNLFLKNVSDVDFNKSIDIFLEDYKNEYNTKFNKILTNTYINDFLKNHSYKYVELETEKITNNGAFKPISINYISLMELQRIYANEKNGFSQPGNYSRTAINVVYNDIDKSYQANFSEIYVPYANTEPDLLTDLQRDTMTYFSKLVWCKKTYNERYAMDEYEEIIDPKNTLIKYELSPTGGGYNNDIYVLCLKLNTNDDLKYYIEFNSILTDMGEPVGYYRTDYSNIPHPKAKLLNPNSADQSGNLRFKINMLSILISYYASLSKNFFNLQYNYLGIPESYQNSNNILTEMLLNKDELLTIGIDLSSITHVKTLADIPDNKLEDFYNLLINKYYKQYSDLKYNLLNFIPDINCLKLADLLKGMNVDYFSIKYKDNYLNNSLISTELNNYAPKIMNATNDIDIFVFMHLYKVLYLNSICYTKSESEGLSNKYNNEYLIGYVDTCLYRHYDDILVFKNPDTQEVKYYAIQNSEVYEIDVFANVDSPIYSLRLLDYSDVSQLHFSFIIDIDDE